MHGFPTIGPIIPTRAAAAFDHPDWLFELKHDGFRAISYVNDGGSYLVSRKNNIYKSFTELRAQISELPVKNAILDGEIVCLDDRGRSQFNPLLHRHGRPAFYVFDLLWLDGQDLRQLPLIQRKDRLRKLIEQAKSPSIIYAQHVEANGTALYREICMRNLEGIVCKKKAGAYSLPGRWLKVLNPNYTQRDGRHEMFTKFHELVRASTAPGVSIR